MLMTHSALPLKEIVDFVKEVTEETVLLTERRAEGGMISFNADRRSYRPSLSRSISSSFEISDSAIYVVRSTLAMVFVSRD